MAFSIVTDSSSNLPTPYLREHGVEVICLSYIIDGKPNTCPDTEAFDGTAYYAAIQSGQRVTTSQIPPQLYLDCFEKLLQQGNDLLYVGMSSGISGSYASAETAAAELREKYPERTLRLVDTLAASLGEGIAVRRAVECRAAGRTIDETADLLMARRQSLYQVVMIGDLMYLRRSGRVSMTKAILGTVLGMRPILKGNAEGQLIVCGKVRGHRAALLSLAEKYRTLVREAGEQLVGIAYTSSPEDAQTLAEMIRSIAPPKELCIVRYEPVTGSHVGPDTVALFFEGDDGVREL